METGVLVVYHFKRISTGQIMLVSDDDKQIGNFDFLSVDFGLTIIGHLRNLLSQHYQSLRIGDSPPL